MSTNLKTQITGLQQEIEIIDGFLESPQNENKSFHASTEIYCLGKPSPMTLEDGLLFLEQGFTEIRDDSVLS
jgi:hypothetical protein